MRTGKVISKPYRICFQTFPLIWVYFKYAVTLQCFN
nr:MAG TPA: hypothetical protein [Caudoviricetes sp.]